MPQAAARARRRRRDDGGRRASSGGVGAGRRCRSDGAVAAQPRARAGAAAARRAAAPPAARNVALGQRRRRAQRIEQHRAAVLASASEPVDRQVIELVTRLFESLLADSLLPGAFRPVISRMQVAALRLCLAEHAVLDSFEHPLWRLLDRIGETSQGYSRSEDPRLSSFLAFAARRRRGDGRRRGARHRALPARPEPRSTSSSPSSCRPSCAPRSVDIDALQLAERRDILQQHLTQRITDQMVAVRTSPTIRRFVTGAWARVIADDMLRHGEQSEATMSALKTVDDLLWSLKIPDHPQSRQRLLSLLPGLLQRIRVGMERIALPAAEQQAVLDELMTIHTEALRPGHARTRRCRRADARGDRAADARRGRRRVGAGAQLQRFGDRPLVDGDRSGRAPAERRRAASTTILPSGSRRCASAIASASSCRAAGAASSCSGAATAACSSCSPANRRRARIRSRGARSSGSARPGWCSRSRPSRWSSERSTG